MVSNVMALINRAYYEQGLDPDCRFVKVWTMHRGESVFVRLPTFAAWFAKDQLDYNKLCHIVRNDTLFWILKTDIRARPEAWGGVDATEDELQLDVEKFLADFVAPADWK